MSKVPAHWDLVKRVVEIRDELGSQALIIGNGDAVSLADAHEKIATSGADGVMLGRAIFGNPWLFHPEKDLATIGIEERLTVMLEHTKLFSELLHFKNFATMKKHYKAYVNGFEGAAQLRAELMEKNTYQEIESVVHAFLKNA